VLNHFFVSRSRLLSHVDRQLSEIDLTIYGCLPRNEHEMESGRASREIDNLFISGASDLGPVNISPSCELQGIFTHFVTPEGLRSCLKML
jgi:hypothetical protein